MQIRIAISKKISNMQARIDICEHCPHITILKTCGTPFIGHYIATGEKLCGCFIHAKAADGSEQCPLKKW